MAHERGRARIRDAATDGVVLWNATDEAITFAAAARQGGRRVHPVQAARRRVVREAGSIRAASSPRPHESVFFARVRRPTSPVLRPTGPRRAAGGEHGQGTAAREADASLRSSSAADAHALEHS